MTMMPGMLSAEYMQGSIARVEAEPGNVDMGPVTEEAVIEVLRDVYDPEIPISIYEMGLIYGIDIGSQGEVYVEMTLTAPGCPVAGTLPREVARRVCQAPGVGFCEVTLVWTPSWTPDMMSEDAKLALGVD